MNTLRIATLTGLVLIIAAQGTAFAQTTEFTYQGRLRDGGLAASGDFDFEFMLFDSLSAGIQQGSTISVSAVAVSAGGFSAALDFGNQFPGADRFLEIRVRQTGSDMFTVLLPRQSINSTPYSIQSLMAATAVNSTQLGGVAANQYVLTGDSRLSDPRVPASGSANYLQNTTSQQAATNFNISGNGTAGGTISGQAVNAAFDYRLGGQQFMSAVSSNSRFGIEAGSPNLGLANTYTGYRAGAAGTSNTSNNAFFGANAGRSNTGGNSNSFFGAQSGELNTTGGFNAFFGNNAGAANVSGNRNAFFGVTAGRDNVQGDDNTFAGAAAGQANQSGSSNSFVGAVAGISNTTGSSNAFFGDHAGQSNVSGTFNTALGTGANVGSGDLSFATALGAGALVTSANTVVIGRNADTVQIPGAISVSGAITGTASNALSLGGVAANEYILSKDARLSDARAPTAGSANYVQNGTSPQAGNFNISGNGSVTGVLSAGTVHSGSVYGLGGITFLKSHFGGFSMGELAGDANGNAPNNTSVGHKAGMNNSSGSNNSQFGFVAGEFNFTGRDNTFVGSQAGRYVGGSGNTFLGAEATGAFGFAPLYSDATAVGFRAGPVGSDFYTNATAIGARAAVTQSNSLVLGSINGVNTATADTSVGIGTTAPAAKLHVNNGDIRVTGGGIVADANVGIGTTAPQAKLHVNNGSIRVTGGGIFVANPNTLVITSPNGSCWGITVNNAGALATFPTSCP